jgi:hypothetical protein
MLIWNYRNFLNDTARAVRKIPDSPLFDYNTILIFLRGLLKKSKDQNLQTDPMEGVLKYFEIRAVK